MAQLDAPLLIKRAIVLFLLALNGAVWLATGQIAKGARCADFTDKTGIKLTLGCRIKLYISSSNTAYVEWHQSVGTGHSYDQFHVRHKGRLLLESSSPAVVYRWTKIPARRKPTGCVVLAERVLVPSPGRRPASIFMV